MSARQDVESPRLSAEDSAEAQLRHELRAFLRDNLGEFSAADSMAGGFNPAFSREMGRRGWIGSSWPKRYGGQDAAAQSRFIIVEEMLAAGA
ncbi:MAG TPA: acyl-CoA dehydrogenase family protein, partial [Bradyrhizobium sp.]